MPTKRFAGVWPEAPSGATHKSGATPDLKGFRHAAALRGCVVARADVLFQRLRSGVHELHALKPEPVYRCFVCAGGDLKECDGMSDADHPARHQVYERMVRTLPDCLTDNVSSQAFARTFMLAPGEDHPALRDAARRLCVRFASSCWRDLWGRAALARRV